MSFATPDQFTPGQHVKHGSFAGEFVRVEKVKRSKNVDVVVNVGGQLASLRLSPDEPWTILDGPATTARAEDHRPIFEDAPLGTRCSCREWEPTKRPTRSSMWNAAYNRHVRSLGLLGI